MVVRDKFFQEKWEKSVESNRRISTFSILGRDRERDEENKKCVRMEMTNYCM